MDTDFLIIGSGIAGLSYALKVAAHGKVLLITKKHSAESNTNYAQGGIAAVTDPADSFDRHVEDTLVAGAGICDPKIVKMVVAEGPDCVRELIELGAEFTREQATLHLELEGGHSASRIVHAADATGREIERSLLEKVQTHPQITVLEYHYCLDLLIVKGECQGVHVVDERDGSMQKLTARCTLLASGGAGQIYAHTTNPAIATGDGVAMAWRAGAKIANMEFYQFHPTSLYHPKAQSFLISEAVRGAGGLLLNQEGERFMPAYHPQAELAPRDVVARAIDDQLKQRSESYVLLDITHLGRKKILHHFPTIHKTCLSFGIEITTQPIPVVPAAHYQCGGVLTDEKARTTIPRLLACGEVTYTGLHGANRLASNSLLEAMVFSRHAAQTALEYAPLAPASKKASSASTAAAAAPESTEPECLRLRQELRQLMWQKVGIVRSNGWLAEAMDALESIKQQVTILYEVAPQSVAVNELRNLLDVAMLITRSALRRQESRGLQFLIDCPQPRARYAKPTIL